MSIRKIGAFIEVRPPYPPTTQYVRASSIEAVIPHTFEKVLTSTNLRNGQTRTIRGSILLLRSGTSVSVYESPEDVLSACNSILALEIMADEGALA